MASKQNSDDGSGSKTGNMDNARDILQTKTLQNRLESQIPAAPERKDDVGLYDEPAEWTHIPAGNVKKLTQNYEEERDVFIPPLPVPKPPWMQVNPSARSSVSVVETTAKISSNIQGVITRKTQIWDQTSDSRSAESVSARPLPSQLHYQPENFERATTNANIHGGLTESASARSPTPQPHHQPNLERAKTNTNISAGLTESVSTWSPPPQLHHQPENLERATTNTNILGGVAASARLPSLQSHHQPENLERATTNAIIRGGVALGVAESLSIGLPPPQPHHRSENLERATKNGTIRGGVAGGVAESLSIGSPPPQPHHQSENLERVMTNAIIRGGVSESVAVRSPPPQSRHLPENVERATTNTTFHGGVTAGVVNIGGKVVIEKTAGSDSSHGTSQRPRQVRRCYVNVAMDANTKEEDNFIKVVNDSTRSNTNYDIRSNFTDFLQEIHEYPSVDCAFTKLNYRSEALLRGASMRQIDVYHAVSLHNVHESINGHIEHHVMLLGGPGEGKSVAAKQYARRVLEKKVPELKDVELVHYIEGSSLGRNREVNPFDLLFTNHLGSCITDSKLTETGEKWVAKHPNKVLLVIDGLDDTQHDPESPRDKISLSTPAKSFVVLCNLFRGDIYKDMWILSTTRWEWTWHVPRSILPARAIELKGFSEHTTQSLLRLFVPKEKHQLIRSMMTRFPEMHELCAIPNHLLTFAKILNGCQCDHNELSQQAILLKVLMYLKTSSPIAARNPKFFYNVLATAYNAAKEDTMEFSHAEATELHDTNLNEIEHFLSVKPDPNNFDVTQESITKFQLRYRFRCKILRNFLAALYVITRTAREWKEITRKDLNTNNNLNDIKLLLHGIVMDENISQAVTTLTERNIDFEKKRKQLGKALSARLGPVLTDLQTVRLLVECKGSHIINAPSEILVGKIDKPRDGHAILSAPRYYKRIIRLRTKSLVIDSTSLDLLGAQESTKYEFHCLVISGEISHCQLENLSMLVKHNKDIKQVILQHYSIKYNTETIHVTMESVQKDYIEIIKGLLHHAPDNAKVSINACKIAGSSRKETITLELIEDLARMYRTEIHLVRIQETMAKVPSVFIDMLKGTSSCSVSQFLLGTVNMSCKQTNRGYKLTIHGDLTDSNLIANVIYQGLWALIGTNDFLLVYENNKVLSVNEEYEITEDSYNILCSLMIKLHCSYLLFSNWKLHAKYKEIEPNRKVVQELQFYSEDELDETNTECARSFWSHGLYKCLLSSRAEAIKIGSYQLHLNHDEEGSLAIRICHLDELFLCVVHQIIAEEKVNEITVDECRVSKGLALREIVTIASIKKMQVNLLVDTSEILRHIDMLMEVCKATSCKLAKIGSDTDVMEIRDSKYIQIESIREGTLLAIIENLSNNLQQGSKIIVSNTSFSGDERAIVEFQNVVRHLLQKQCEVMIEKISFGCDFRYMPFPILDLASTLQTRSIHTNDVHIAILYDAERKITTVNFDDIVLEDLRSFTRGCFTRVRKLDVSKLHILSGDEMEGSLGSLIRILNEEPVCTIKTLLVPCDIGSIFEKLRQYMDAGKLLNINSRHHGGMTITRKTETDEFCMYISRTSINECDDITDSFGDFLPENIVIEELEIGEDQNNIERQLAGIESDEMKTFLMENAKRFSQQKLLKHMASVDKFCEKNHVSIATLLISGDIPDLDAMLCLTKKLSISSVVASNIKISYNHTEHQENSLTLVSGKVHDILRLKDVLDDDWIIFLDPLQLGDLRLEKEKQNYHLVLDELLTNEKIKANSVEVSCDLCCALDEMVLIQRRHRLSFITTSDYILEIEYQLDEEVALDPHLRVEDGGEHTQAMQEFAWKIGAQIKSPSVFSEPELNDPERDSSHGDGEVCEPSSSGCEEDYYEPLPLSMLTRTSSGQESIVLQQETAPKDLYMSEFSDIYEEWYMP